MQRQLEQIVSELGADTGTIHLLGDDGVLVLQAHVGISPAVLALVRTVPVGKGMAGLAVLRNEPVSSCNIQTDTSGDVRPGARLTGVNGAIVVPIRDATTTKKGIRGALGIAVNRPHTYSAEETARLLELAAEVR